mmetsp:Transcript_14549/g.35611  ORF Transcript_14549/g.35611 Transcript_14549/m.35611 type:complete len:122 (+) Transcript_14549:372-737(+)
MKEALRIFKKTLWDEHSKLISTLGSIVVVYQRQEKLGKAFVYAERGGVAAHRRERLGRGHPQFADALACRSSLLALQGRRAEALEGWREALSIREQQLGGGHPHLANVCVDIAKVLTEDGD